MYASTKKYMNVYKKKVVCKMRSVKKVIGVLLTGLLVLSAMSITVSATMDEASVTEDVVYEEGYDEGYEEGTEEGNSTDEGDVGTVITDTMTVTEDELAKGAELVAPAAKAIRTVIAAVIALLSVVIVASSIYDVLCISIRPICQRVPTAGNQQGEQDLLTKMASWASNDAVVAIQQAGVVGGGQNTGGAGMGMPGMGMSGMGMGMPGMGGKSQVPKTKQILPIYLRKRAVFLVVFGICLVVFCSVAFTNLGLDIGNWVVQHVSNITIG
jgi:hypothetical protein